MAAPLVFGGLSCRLRFLASALRCVKVHQPRNVHHVCRHVHISNYQAACRLAEPSVLSMCTRRYSSKTEIVEDDAEPDVLYKAIDIEVKGHDPAVMNSYEKFVSMAANELDITVSNISTPPKIIERYTLLKSVHVYKKKRVQYETRTHFRTFEVKYLTGSTADTFLEYIQRNLPEGVAMKVTKHQVEALPSHIKPPEKELSSPTQ